MIAWPPCACAGAGCTCVDSLTETLDGLLQKTARGGLSERLRVVREVGALVRRAVETNKRLATLSIDTEIRFRSAAERAEFSQQLATSVAALVARYHDAAAPAGRSHRLLVLAHPLPTETKPGDS